MCNQTIALETLYTFGFVPEMIELQFWPQFYKNTLFSLFP